MRLTPVTLGVVSVAVLANFGQSPPEVRRIAQDECIISLSGFPKDTPLAPKPAYPIDLTGVTLQYFASGCLGDCPAFTLTISKNSARFDGRAFVRAKGKRTAKLSRQQFETFLHPWYEGNFYAMRENYCDVHCPDGTVVIVTDIPESSITLTTPAYTKRVYECFATVNNQPQTPKPPQQYFELSLQLRAFAKVHHWL